jgi:hypothetical protein
VTAGEAGRCWPRWPSCGSGTVSRSLRRLGLAAEGNQLSDREERSALDWFLGATKALEFDVPVEWDTPDGTKRLIFHMRQVDEKRLEELDSANRQGDPSAPFRKLDVGGFNAAVIAEALQYVSDEGGQQRTPDEVRGGAPSLEMALPIRFKYQPGLLEGLAERVREKAGFTADRVGTASRSVVEAGKP